MSDEAPKPARRGWPAATAWIVTVLGAVAIAFFAFDLLRRCTPLAVVDSAGSAARDVAQSLRDVLRPSVTVNPIAILRGEDATPKLVVYTHMADVGADLNYDGWFGDTYSHILARNCRVQFVVPVERMTDRDVVFIPGSGGEPARIVVIAPRPRVDVDMLVIAPESLEFTERNTGLLYARSWLGIDNREQLTRQLRPRLLEAVADPKVRARAEEAGRAFFEKRFADWLRSDLQLGRDVVVDVRWTE